MNTNVIPNRENCHPGCQLIHDFVGVQLLEAAHSQNGLILCAHHMNAKAFSKLGA